MSRVVLFGASGFIGSHIRTRLSDKRLVTPSRREVDLQSADQIRSVLRPGDVVINAAGYAQPTDRSPQAIEHFRNSNVVAVKNLATVGAESGIAQFIHMSSVAAMGTLTGENLGEDARGPITSPYAESKREAESVLNGFQSALPITILRPTSVFGEGRGLALTLCRLARSPIVFLPAGGRALIPFTYVGNVVEAVVAVVGNRRAYGGTFIVGDDRSYALRSILLELSCWLGCTPRTLSVPTAATAAAVWAYEGVARLSGRSPLVDRGRLAILTTSVSYSTARITEAVGYEPRYSLSEGLRRIAYWYLESSGRRG